MASPNSLASLPRRSPRPGSLNDRPPSPGSDADVEPDEDDDLDANTVPVETLVELLLAAKRSLSSMTLVLRANELATYARQLHEETVVQAAQTAFLRRGITDQARILHRVRRALQRAYNAGKRDFKQLIKTLDAGSGALQQTMDMLRNTVVESVFRPPGEEPRNLLDFVDETSVEGMHDALKASIAELQAAQTSFDGDLLRFDNDLRALVKTMSDSPTPPSPSGSTGFQPIPQLLASLTANSHAMAEHLTSLTRHFDMCVTAVRTTEGGTALARRKAAEVTQSQGADAVSISGVIAEQEQHVADLEPISAEERAEIVEVVVKDAPEVDEVVAELHAVLPQMEDEYAALKAQADLVRDAYVGTVGAFHVLEDVGSRLASYVAAETEYLQRWEDEKDIIFAKLEEMDDMRTFYDRYGEAYQSLLLEVARRRSAESKIQNIWKKAKDSVDKLVEEDRKERENFRQDIGEFLPTDLWVGMGGPLKQWDVVPREVKIEEEDAGQMESSDRLGNSSFAAVAKAKARPGKP